MQLPGQPHPQNHCLHKLMGAMAYPSPVHHRSDPCAHNRCCVLVRVTPNNSNQACPHPLFLCIPEYATANPGLSCIPSSSCVLPWVLQLISTQPTNANEYSDQAHMNANEYCCLDQPGPPPALAFMLTNRIYNPAGKCPQFPSRPAPSPRSYIC